MSAFVSDQSSSHTYRFQFRPNILTCSSCTAPVKQAISQVQGVVPDSISISFRTGILTASGECTAETIMKAIDQAIGSRPTLVSNESFKFDSTPFDHDKKPLEQTYLWRSLLAGVFGISLMILEILGLIPSPHLLIGQLILGCITLISMGVMTYCGWDIYRDALKKLRTGHVNMNTLVGLGSLLALIYSLLLIGSPALFPMLAGTHLSLCAGVLILAIVNLGSYLKGRAESRATAHVPKIREEYLRLQPRWVYSTDTQGNPVQEVHFRDINRGDTFLAEAGHYFPVDGTIVSSDAHILVDERTLTGEKTVRSLSTGAQVRSGTLYKIESRTQSLVLKADCNGEEGSFHVMMVQVAKALLEDPDNTSLNRFLTWFVRAVLMIALSAGLLWCFLGTTPSMGIAVFIAVLLCACPCALGLTAPIAYSTAVNIAFRHGIVIRKVDALAALARVKAIAFDLTGTLTEGEMTLTACSEGITDEVLQWIASLEHHSQSRHPIAGVILSRNKRALLSVNQLAVEAHGISGIVNDQHLKIGSAAWLTKQGITIPPEVMTRNTSVVLDDILVPTTVYVSINGQFSGYIEATQRLRAEALETIDRLNQLGYETFLLTGAQVEVAQQVAERLKIQTVQAQQTPKSKKKYLEGLKRKVVFLGDDPNDFPGLTAQNVIGMSIHPQAPAAGLACINLSGKLNDLDKVIQVAQAMRHNLHFGIGFMGIYNLISIAFAAGLFFVLTGAPLDPILATVLMGISSLMVVLNGMSLQYSIEHKLQPNKNFPRLILGKWCAAPRLDQLVQWSLCLFSFLLLGTVIANVAFGFSGEVILKSMILACTCCTGLVGILSAVGFIGLGVTLLCILGQLFYQRYRQSTLTRPDINSSKPSEQFLGKKFPETGNLLENTGGRVESIGPKLEGLNTSPRIERLNAF